MAEEREPVEPLIDRVTPLEREALGSFHRYFMWSNDLLGQYTRLIRESPFGQLMKAGLTAAEALEKSKTDSSLVGELLTVFYAFPYMSYYYGSMFVVIEGWNASKVKAPTTIVTRKSMS